MRYVYGSYVLPWSWVLAAVALTLTLSVLSYAMIERRTKSLAVRFRTAFVVMFVLPVLVLAGAAHGLQRLRSIEPVRADLSTYGQDVCHGNFDQRCVRGDPSKVPTVLVIGDSHAAALNEFIDVLGRHEGWSGRVLTASSCSPVFGYDEMALPAFAQKPCRALKAYVADHYRDYRAVVIASYWAYQLDMTDLRADPGYREKLDRTLREMSQSLPVYVISDVPRLPIQPFREQRFLRLGLKVDRHVSDVSLKGNEIVRRLVAPIPNVHWVSLAEALSGFQHLGLYDGEPAYFDEQHLNIQGSRALANLFIRDGGHLL
jgi:hypothetical protein